MCYHYSTTLSAISAVVSTFFFFNATSPTKIYTLSLHDALPIYLGTSWRMNFFNDSGLTQPTDGNGSPHGKNPVYIRSEEHTSELQSHHDLVCRLLLEKKKKQKYLDTTSHINNPLSFIWRRYTLE